MQLLFLANERLREEQRSELEANDQSLRARFLGPEDFQMSALDAPRLRHVQKKKWIFILYLDLDLDLDLYICVHICIAHVSEFSGERVW